MVRLSDRSVIGGLILVGGALIGGLALAGFFANEGAQAQESVDAPPPASGAETLGALDTVPVPLPSNLDEFVTNRTLAIEIGKSLFWDLQVGSDGRTACASCHFHAGADNRTRNTLAPRTATFRGANVKLKASDFPFHRLHNPDEKRSSDNSVVFDTSEVVGSQGVVKTEFMAINERDQRDIHKVVPDPLFSVDGINRRQVTGRNTPTVINAIYNDRLFWDGRANRFFNGVNPFGEMDPDAKIWQADDSGTLSQVRILLDNAAAASQAVGPPNNDVEMSCSGRTFPLLGRKMLALRPLQVQKIAKTDSVLGHRADVRFGFKDQTITYATLVRQAFPAKYWKSNKVTPEGDTLMEANFSLFWGLSVMLYESTLISNDSPFDRYAKGNDSALSDAAKEGLRIFTHEGQCSACHRGPEFTGAAISQRRSHSNPSETLIERMIMGNGEEAAYDGGFYNIGVRPTQEDLGVGGSHPTLGPWSYSRRQQEGRNPNLNGQDISIGPGDRVAVDGAFKTPSLRNVELTGPYMHNGGMRTLTEVVQFYARGGDFHHENRDNLDSDIGVIDGVIADHAKISAVVAFLKSLTDERVRREAAPFDHPSLVIYDGSLGSSEGRSIDDDVFLPAVGREGAAPLKAFEEVLK